MKNITFINAGAGSGKTFRLTEELYQAIRNKQCKANEVMLTTFTKKAAEEIKVKAREKLLKENLALDANQLENALIGTIHSVGSQIIQKFWHYIGMPKEIKVMDENDTNFYFNQAIASIPTDAELKQITDINYRFNPRNSEGFYDEDKWKSDLIKIIELARTNHIEDFSASEQESIKHAGELLKVNNKVINLRVIHQAINDILNIRTRLPEKHPKYVDSSINKVSNINKYNITYPDLFNIQQCISDLKKKEYDEGRLDNVALQLEAIQRSNNLYQDIKTYNHLLFKLAERSMKTYTDYKKEVGLIDYADMEDGFLKLLDIDVVQKELKNTVKLVLVDEFQDSSPIQLAIFIKLSHIVDKSIWVGDPKQSIYGFRGTDPQLIDTIIKHFESGKVNGLTTDNLPDSWRSRPDIVKLCNGIFVPALKDQVKEDTIALNPVRTDSGFNKAALHHLQFFEKRVVKDKEKLCASKECYYSGLAKSIVHLLELQLTVSDKNKCIPNKNPDKEIVHTQILKPNDIAILCKTNDAVEYIANELKALGVEVTSEISGLEITAEYQLVLSLLKLILAEENSLARAQIKVLTEPNYLTAELVDDRLEFLSDLPLIPEKPNAENFSNENEFEKAALAYSNSWMEYSEKLNQWGNNNLLISNLQQILPTLKELPVPQLIEQLINRLNLYEVVAKWGKPEQRRGNLQKIIEYAFKYDERCVNMSLGASLVGFINYIEQEDDKKEAQTRSEEAVNVLTYHKSKGLEWPVVVLADIQKDVDWGFICREIFGIRMHNTAAIDLEQILSNRVINLLPWMFGAAHSKVSDDFEQSLEEHSLYNEAKTRHENELKRVMYVGMTRPRDYLITTGIESQKSYKWMDLINQHNNWTFSGSTNGQTENLVDVFDRRMNFAFHKLELEAKAIDKKGQTPSYFANKVLESSNNIEPYFVSPSKVSFKGKVHVKLDATVQKRLNIGASLAGKEDILGNCLHDILYLMVLAKKKNDQGNIQDSINSLIANHELEGALHCEEVQMAFNKLFDYLEAAFKPESWYGELPVISEINDQLFKGEVDLLLENEDGYILIDYKSFPGTIEQVLDEQNQFYAGKYAGQLNCYTQMLEKVTAKKVVGKYIYYTVLGNLIKMEY